MTASPQGAAFPSRHLRRDPAHWLSVTDPGVAHHLELDRCSTGGNPTTQIALQLFLEGSTVPVAEGTPVVDGGPDQTCLRIDHTFDVAGSYLMKISSRLDAGFPSGSFYFRFY